MGKRPTVAQGRRRWRGGSTYPRADGSWVAAISLGHDAAGRRIRKEFRASSEAQAARILEDNERRLRGGLPFADERMTLALYADEWLGGMKPSVGAPTWAVYEIIVRLHLADIGHVSLLRLSPGLIRELIGRRFEEGYAPRTVRGILSILRAILRQAQLDGHISRNVADAVAMPKLERAERPSFSIEQSRQILAAISGDSLEALYATALGTGLRRSELLRLTWADVDLARGAVAIRRGKSRTSVRLVPLPGFAIARLAAMSRTPGPLWRANPDYVTRHFKALMERAGLPALPPHALRHTTNSIQAQLGVKREVRQRSLGHADEDMTDRYTHALWDLQVDAARRLDEAIG